jgi:hypothetical protein
MAAPLIRLKRLTPLLLDAWLVDQQLTSAHSSYRLRVWRENRAELDPIRDELVAYVDEAFDDARHHLRRGFEDALSPFNDPATDPAANFPAQLHISTLQGYFGEILAGMAIEHWGACDNTDWAIPAFLFRIHVVGFQHLDLINERLATGETHDPDCDSEQRPGRTGDDGLAFRVDEENNITEFLVIEAKCLGQNRTEKVRDAHEKLSAGASQPSGIRELVSLLAEYNTPEAHAWHKALLDLWLSRCQNAVRHDCIAYACGQIPAGTRRRTAWLSTDAPHSGYQVNRNLEAVEFQFADLPRVIRAVFRGD